MYLKEYARGLEFSVKPDYLTIKNSFMKQYIELGFAAEDIDKYYWGTLPVSIRYIFIIHIYIYIKIVR